MKKNRIDRFISHDDDFKLILPRPPADAIARQARPGVKAGNPGIDSFYEQKRREEYEKSIKTPEIKNPSTKLEDLFSYYNDMKAQENLAFIRVVCGNSKSEMFSYLQEKRKDIDKRYEKLLNSEDCYSFNGLDKVLSFLCTTNLFPKKQIINQLIHEQQHANEAIARGYNIKGYNCWLCLDKKNKPTYVVVTRVPILELPPEKDYRAITAAPKNQSVIDLLSVPIPPLKKRANHKYQKNNGTPHLKQAVP